MLRKSKKTIQMRSMCKELYKSIVELPTYEIYNKEWICKLRGESTAWKTSAFEIGEPYRFELKQEFTIWRFQSKPPTSLIMKHIDSY